MKLLKAIARLFNSNFFLSFIWAALSFACLLAIIHKDKLDNSYVIFILCLFTLRTLHFFFAGILSKHKLLADTEEKKTRFMKNTLVIFRLLFLLFAISAVYWIISIVQSDAPSKKDTAAIISAFVFGFYHVISALSEWRKLRAEND